MPRHPQALKPDPQAGITADHDGQAAVASRALPPLARHALVEVVGHNEEEWALLNRALNLLSGCNQVLVRAQNESELLHGICRLAVEIGGLRMAWVGLVEHDADRTIRPVAHAGVEEGYLDTVCLTWADTERGRGPAGVAVRTGEPCWLNNLAAAPTFHLGREEALRRGYVAVSYLPLLHGGQTLGVLGLFAGEREAFTEEVIGLFRQLADALASGLDSLRSRAVLRESEQFARSTLDSLAAPIAILDSTGTILAVNQAWRRFAADNPPVRELVLEGANYLEVCEQTQGGDRDTAVSFAAGIRAVLAGNRPEFSMEHTSHSSAEPRWFLGRVTRFQGDGPVRVVVAHENLTACKQAEMRAQLRADVFGRLARELGATSTAKEAGQIIVSAADELFGWDACLLHLYDGARDEVQRVISMDTINGQKVHDTHPSADLTPTEMFRKVLREGKQLILRDGSESQTGPCICFGDTSRRSESLMYVPIRHDLETVGVLSIQSYTPGCYNQDALDTLQALADYCAGALARIRARASLEASEARYRLLVENQAEGLGIVDNAGRFMFANPAAERVFGVAGGGLLGRALFEFLSEEQRVVVQQQRERQADGEPATFELAITRPDGHTRVLLVTATPQTDNDGHFNQMFTVFRDITQRKRAELMVARSELRLRLVWDHALTPMRLSDETGKIVMVNRAYCQLARKSRGQLEGQPLWMTYDPANKDTIIRDYMERFQRGNDIQQRTVEVKYWDGRRVWLEMAETFFNLPGQPPLLLSVARDITERRELEAQIRQMQRLESVGQLAAGVAHDFNNMLAVVQGQAYILKLDLGEDSPAAESVRQIQQAAERAANLTRQLLLFSRKQTLQAKVINLGETVQNMAKMLRRLLGEHIEIQFVAASEPASVLADVGMMEQVLLNLCVNARDAMPHGGELRVETSGVEVTADAARHTPEARAGRHVRLSVTDTGSGIPPEVLARIFEPFFTTKEVGKGTGLGLATVYGIVKQHQGWITVDTRVGEGTTFNVFLPFHDGQTPASNTEPTEPKLLAGNGKTLLVVEDEPGLRGVTRTILQRQGYRVLTAESGPQALDLAKATGPLDLVITDMVMPHMNGRELVMALRKLQPKVRVLFTSGYSDESGDTAFFERMASRFLAKPYPAEVLCQTVADCLKSPPA